ncbi:transcription initiation protein [Aquimarina sp. D1M17]|uniref:YciI family protein n=1 Tax=Aquimarina acroporae TaxID=2937283 RepID=UPI0020BD6684|nr:transcription initiation protein [Aquimarina acroporae]MCK8522359.1 transcription initiation protein [Aquimarina acroporae]
MKEFMMILRASSDFRDYKPTPEEIEVNTKKWQSWIGNIAEQGKLIKTNEIGVDSKVINSDNAVSQGPYVVDGEVVTGFMLLKADSAEDAASLADGCPILDMGGKIEIRDLVVY